MSTVRHKPSTKIGGFLGRKNNASCGDRAVPSVRLSDCDTVSATDYY